MHERRLQLSVSDLGLLANYPLLTILNAGPCAIISLTTYTIDIILECSLLGTLAVGH